MPDEVSQPDDESKVSAKVSKSEKRLRLDQLPKDSTGDRAWLEAKRQKAKAQVQAQAQSHAAGQRKQTTELLQVRAKPKAEADEPKLGQKSQVKKGTKSSKFLSLLQEQQLVPLDSSESQLEDGLQSDLAEIKAMEKKLGMKSKKGKGEQSSFELSELDDLFGEPEDSGDQGGGGDIGMGGEAEETDEEEEGSESDGEMGDAGDIFGGERDIGSADESISEEEELDEEEEEDEDEEAEEEEVGSWNHMMCMQAVCIAVMLFFHLYDAGRANMREMKKKAQRRMQQVKSGL